MHDYRATAPDGQLHLRREDAALARRIGRAAQAVDADLADGGAGMRQQTGVEALEPVGR